MYRPIKLVTTDRAFQDGCALRDAAMISPYDDSRICSNLTMDPIMGGNCDFDTSEVKYYRAERSRENYNSNF